MPRPICPFGRRERALDRLSGVPRLTRQVFERRHTRPTANHRGVIRSERLPEKLQSLAFVAERLGIVTCPHLRRREVMQYGGQDGTWIRDFHHTPPRLAQLGLRRGELAELQVQ